MPTKNETAPQVGPDDIAGLPALPRLTNPRSAEHVAKAYAAAADLAEKADKLNVDLQAAIADGDADAIIAAQAGLHEVSVRRWAAERTAIEVEIAAYDAELERLDGCTAPYEDARHRALADIGTAEHRLAKAEEALHWCSQAVQRTYAARERLEAELDALKAGPADLRASSASGGWS